MKTVFKFCGLAVIVVFMANTAFASPRSSRTKGSLSGSSTSKSSSRLKGNTSGRGNSYYSGITNHEASAERQKETERQYQEQLKAAREGRPIPMIAGAGNKAQIAAARRAALEEKRAKRAEEMEQRRLERDAKREARLAAQEEKRAKKLERKNRGKKKGKSDGLSEVEGELAKKPKPKPTEPDKLEGF